MLCLNIHVSEPQRAFGYFGLSIWMGDSVEYSTLWLATYKRHARWYLVLAARVPRASYAIKGIDIRTSLLMLIPPSWYTYPPTHKVIK